MLALVVACLLLEGLSNRKRFEAVKVLRRVTKQRGKRGMRRDNLFRCLYRTVVQYIVRYGTVRYRYTGNSTRVVFSYKQRSSS